MFTAFAWRIARMFIDDQKMISKRREFLCNHEAHQMTRKFGKETGRAQCLGCGVFAGPLPSELEDGPSKTPLHLLRELPAVA
jgi:hypothetical protein